MKHNILYAALILLIIALVIFAVKNELNRTPLHTSKGKGIIELNGYTYYKWNKKLAPTPETIKRCIKEAQAEIKAEKIEDDNSHRR